MKLGKILLLLLCVSFVFTGCKKENDDVSNDPAYTSLWVNTKISVDNDNDGVIDFTVAVYTYDSNGNLVKEEADLTDDGVIDKTQFWTYDSNGNLIKEEIDYGNDGTIEFTYNFTYDSDGNEIKRRIVEDIDGNIDETVYYFAWEEITVPASSNVELGNTANWHPEMKRLSRLPNGRKQNTDIFDIGKRNNVSRLTNMINTRQ